MFGIGTTELLMILVVALLVLGPKKLPEIARTLGKGLAEFRRVSSDFNRTIQADVEREEMTERKKKAEKEYFGDKPEAKPTASRNTPSADAAAPATAQPDDSTTATPDAASKAVIDVEVDAVSAAPASSSPAPGEEKKA